MGVASLDEASDQHLLLAARPPSRLQRAVAYGVTAGLLVIFGITAPFADLPLQRVTAFIPVYATAMLIIDLITATFIFAQFWVVRWTWLLVLASGFFFTALISVPFALTFPEAFAPSGLLGAGAQTAAWLGMCWHLGSPMVLIIAILVKGSRETTGTWQRSPVLAIGLSVALVAVVVCGLTWALVVANDHVLPWIFVYRVPGHNNLALFSLVIALNVIALVLLWVKGRSVLDLWVMVMCSSWLFKMLLSGVLAGSRYSLGWYTGRLFELAAIVIVLLIFLSETTALYANLARASIQRRGARHARQIAMDAMAASLGHEIKQPLTAVMTNVKAGLLQVSKAEPDLKEVHAILSDIAADGQRIKEIIGGVRTMFTKSTHNRQPLDVNDVIRDVLTMVELDARRQRVTIKTDLDGNLPPVLADSGQLHQVFLNLVTNALEAMIAVSSRSSVLRITSGVARSDVAVTVEDTGVGIPDKVRGRILEPFFSTKAAGTGVGLTICKVVIEAHGGRLQASPNEPYGTIFRITLPMSDDE